MLEKKTSPVNCRLAKVITQEAKSGPTIENKTVKNSPEIYGRVLSLFKGKTSGFIGDARFDTDVSFDVGQWDSFDEVYRKLGGTWVTAQEEVAGKVIYAAAISCRRDIDLLKERGPNGNVWYFSAQKATEGLMSLAKGRAGKDICASCPYSGMNPAEADKYDAEANRAEAERLSSEMLLSRARNELELHLKELGLNADDGSGINTSNPQ